MMAIGFLRITGIAALLTAAAAGLSALIGWLVFTTFGAVTMIFLYIALNLVLVLGFAGMVIGSLAVTHAPDSPEHVAIASATVICLAVMAVGTWLQLAEVLHPLAPIILPVAGIRAWFEKKRQRKLA
jgi:hypothetical protein